MCIAIIQARSSSRRLPGKVLKTIFGKAMLLHELGRLERSQFINRMILATSQDSSDDELVNLCQKNGIEVFRGSLDDVLDRYYQCASLYKPEHVVRITGDCPLLDWNVVDAVIRKHLTEKNDYTSNTLQVSYPDGLDVEVMRYDALEKAWNEAELPSEREHVTQYLIKHPEFFKQGNLRYRQDLSVLRWTVDEPEDFQFVTKVYEALYRENAEFTMQDVLDLLNNQPELIKINNDFERNEGLLKSFREDKDWKGED